MERTNVAGEIIPARPSGVQARDVCSRPLVRQLLRAYEAELDAVETVPPLVWVRFTHRKPGRLLRIRSFPRPRWLLRLFVLRHVDATLVALWRHYTRRSALGVATDADLADRRAVEEFREALPRVPARAYTVALVVAVVLLGQVILANAGRVKSAAGEVSVRGPRGAGGGNDPVQAAITKARGVLADALQGAASLDMGSTGQLLGSLFELDAVALLFLALVVAGALWGLLRLLVPQFRLKRMLFNLHPDVPGYRRLTTARWHVPRATGVYELERALFVELGARPPKEFPLDLAVLAGPAVVLFGLGCAYAVFLVLDELNDPTFRGLVPRLTSMVAAVVFASPIVAIAALRLNWLRRTWRRRREDGRGAHLPLEVGIASSDRVALMQIPAVVAAITLAPFGFWLSMLVLSIAFLLDGTPITEWAAMVLGVEIMLLSLVSLFLAPWWYRINRELRDLGRARGVKLGRIPVLSLIAALLSFTVVPPLVSTIRGCRRIARAQADSGLPPSLRPVWLLVPGLLTAPPLVFAHLQRELNKVWQAVGVPLPDAPLEPFP